VHQLQYWASLALLIFVSLLSRGAAYEVQPHSYAYGVNFCDNDAPRELVYDSCPTDSVEMGDSSQQMHLLSVTVSAPSPLLDRAAYPPIAKVLSEFVSPAEADCNEAVCTHNLEGLNVTSIGDSPTSGYDVYVGRDCIPMGKICEEEDDPEFVNSFCHHRGRGARNSKQVAMRLTASGTYYLAVVPRLNPTGERCSFRVSSSVLEITSAGESRASSITCSRWREEDITNVNARLVSGDLITCDAAAQFAFIMSILPYILGACGVVVFIIIVTPLGIAQRRKQKRRALAAYNRRKRQQQDNTRMVRSDSEEELLNAMAGGEGQQVIEADSYSAAGASRIGTGTTRNPDDLNDRLLDSRDGVRRSGVDMMDGDESD